MSSYVFLKDSPCTRRFFEVIGFRFVGDTSSLCPVFLVILDNFNSDALDVVFLLPRQEKVVAANPVCKATTVAQSTAVTVQLLLSFEIPHENTAEQS